MPNDETLLKEKLYAHQAIQDSVIIKDGEVRDKMNTN
jgi:hypothetical protein